ncbi:MAG: XRE family transcriptional regulator [Carbonactinosporaceae bacterium]
MTEKAWYTLDEITRRRPPNEAAVAGHKAAILAEVRVHQLAELRKAQGLRQSDVAEQMHVTQARVSTLERGDLGRLGLDTVRAYVEALGGRVEVVASFGDTRFVIR